MKLVYIPWWCNERQGAVGNYMVMKGGVEWWLLALIMVKLQKSQLFFPSPFPQTVCSSLTCLSVNLYNFHTELSESGLLVYTRSTKNSYPLWYWWGSSKLHHPSTWTPKSFQCEDISMDSRVKCLTRVSLLKKKTIIDIATLEMCSNPMRYARFRRGMISKKCARKFIIGFTSVCCHMVTIMCYRIWSCAHFLEISLFQKPHVSCCHLYTSWKTSTDHNRLDNWLNVVNSSVLHCHSINSLYTSSCWIATQIQFCYGFPS